MLHGKGWNATTVRLRGTRKKDITGKLQFSNLVTDPLSKNLGPQWLKSVINVQIYKNCERKQVLL